MNKRIHFKASVLSIALLLSIPVHTIAQPEETSFTKSPLEQKIIDKDELFVSSLFSDQTPDKAITDLLAYLTMCLQQAMPMPTKMFKDIFGQESFEYIEKITELKEEMTIKFVGHLKAILAKKGDKQYTSETENQFGKSLSNFTKIVDYYLYKTIYHYAQEKNITVDSFNLALPVDKQTQATIDEAVEEFVVSEPNDEEIQATLVALGLMNIVQDRHPEIAQSEQNAQSMTPATMAQMQQKTAGTMKALQEISKDANKKVQDIIQKIVMGQVSGMLKNQNLDPNSQQAQQTAMLLMAAATMQTMQQTYKTLYNKLKDKVDLASMEFDVDGVIMKLPTPELMDKKDLPQPKDLAKKLTSITQIIEL